jgi:hypothetical protein
MPSMGPGQAYRLLIESTGGRLAIVAVSLRTPPDLSMISDLAGLIDERPFELASRERICGEFGERHGISIELLDCDLDKDDPVAATAALSRAIARDVRESKTAPWERVSLPELRAATAERLYREWAALRDGFIAQLNAHAVTTARAIDGLRPSSYNYLNSVRGTAVPRPLAADSVAGARSAARGAKAALVDSQTDEQRRNRAQAMAVFPFLHRVVMTQAFEDVRNAIDEGQALVDVLADHYGVSRGMIRTLRGVTSDDLGRWSWHLGIVLKVMREIPADWWPRDPATWRRFTDSINAISRISRHPITTSANLLWLRRCVENNYTLQEKTPEDLERLGHDIDEFMESLRRALYWTFSQTVATSRPGLKPIQIMARFKAEIGLPRLCEIMRRFGDAYRRAVMEFAEEAELWRGVRWPALCSGTTTYGEITIVPLLTPEALKQEGIRMGNCVASYVESCMKGKSQIWSVRLLDGTPLTTLETRIRTWAGGRRDLEIVQHKGVHNGPAPEAAQAAARAHVSQIAGSSFEMQKYLDWKQTISRQPLELRQRHALVLPIISAMKSTLKGKWSWDRLVAMRDAAPVVVADSTSGAL